MFHNHSQAQPIKQAQRLLGLTLVGTVILGGISAQAATALTNFPSPLIAQIKPTLAQASKQRLPRPVARRVQRDLAQRLNIPQRDLKVVSFSRETWGDSCLGLAADNERCATATVEGWRIELTNGQQNWFYRTDLTGRVFRLETKDPASLPPQVMERLIETVAQQVRVPASTLKVIESRPATWDGCMGIYEPGRACTRIAIAGWQVVVAGEQQSWVYHVSQDASRIVQNATASGSRGEIFISFIPEGNTFAPLAENVVFRMTVSGGLAGMVTETFLTSDGTIYRQTRGLNTPTTRPTVVKRLSQQQVQQFQQVLEQQKFPNLNGLRYLTSAAFADYPTTTFQTMGTTVEYIDLAKGDLPQALQSVIQAWERL